jgi:hypothetical protein
VALKFDLVTRLLMYACDMICDDTWIIQNLLNNLRLVKCLRIEQLQLVTENPSTRRFLWQPSSMLDNALMNAATINRVAVLVNLGDYIICEDQETSRLQVTICSAMRTGCRPANTYDGSEA